jgi:hypothetical protein
MLILTELTTNGIDARLVTRKSANTMAPSPSGRERTLRIDPVNCTCDPRLEYNAPKIAAPTTANPTRKKTQNRWLMT